MARHLGRSSGDAAQPQNQQPAQNWRRNPRHQPQQQTGSWGQSSGDLDELSF